MKLPNSNGTAPRLYYECDSRTHMAKLGVHIQDLHKFAERVASRARGRDDLTPHEWAALVDEARRLVK